MVTERTIHVYIDTNYVIIAEIRNSNKKISIYFELTYNTFFLIHLELKRRSHPCTTVVPSKTIMIPDSRPKWAKSIPVIRPKRRKNQTTLSAARTYMAYITESPPPPPDRVCVIYLLVLYFFFSLLLFYLSTLCKKYHL